MIVKSSIKLGGKNYVFEATDNVEMEALHKAIVLAHPRGTCNECGNSEKELFDYTSNKDKEGNVYVNVKCYGMTEQGNVCDAKSKLGQYKNGGYFWHNFERYVPQN
jgi:C1A family cysteine protease